MDITRTDVDTLNTVVNIAIEKEDYQPKVDKTLQDYRKQASVPGFRKGHVPMSLIKKQYEKSVMIDEVNKLLQDALNKFLTEEKLDILGNPIPKQNDDFTWDNEAFDFDFEIGLAPQFTVDLEAKNKLVYYEVEAEKSFVEDEITNIRKQFGKLISQDEVKDDSRMVGIYHFDYKGEAQEKNTVVELSQIKGKTNQKKFIGAKAGDVIKLKTKGLYKDDHDLMHALGLDHDDAHGFDAEATFTINEINTSELAEMNQDLFDKVLGKDMVKTEKELREKIKESAERQFANQSDQKFLNDATDFLLENTKFDLPSEFLKRWLQISGEKEMTPDEATTEYERSERGLRYQLIEGQLAKDNDLKVSFDDLKNHTRNLLKAQYAAYGQDLMQDDFIDGVVDNVLKNQEEVKRLSEQIMSEKLLQLYKEKLNYKTKKVSYKDFVEESYK
jgi:trigger factor